MGRHGSKPCPCEKRGATGSCRLPRGAEEIGVSDRGISSCSNFLGETLKYFLPAALCVSLVLGCGKGPTEPADINQAGLALRTALEAWKSGKAQQELAARTPPSS
jgi:hypothetical protein